MAILNNLEMHERLSRESAAPVGNSPVEIDKWRKVIKAAGIQPT